MVERQVEALRVRGSIPLPSIACILVLSGFWLNADTKKMQAKKNSQKFSHYQKFWHTVSKEKTGKGAEKNV